MTATIRGVMVSSLKDLARLRADGLGLFGSGDELFGNAIFGRDSASCAETLVRLRPGLARDIILSLARLQGTVEAPIGPQSNEEETGKIHHEHRSLFVAGRRVPPDSENRLRELASRWGGDATSLTYYGSVDATPLFVRAIGAFCAIHGDGILTEPVLRHDGSMVALRDSVLAAVDWLIRSMDAGTRTGFLSRSGRIPAPPISTSTAALPTGTRRLPRSRSRATRMTRSCPRLGYSGSRTGEIEPKRSGSA